MASGRLAPEIPVRFIRVVADPDSGAVTCIQGVGKGVAELAAPLHTQSSSAPPWMTWRRASFPHPALGEALTDAVVIAIRRASERQAAAA